MKAVAYIKNQIHTLYWICKWFLRTVWKFAYHFFFFFFLFFSLTITSLINNRYSWIRLMSCLSRHKHFRFTLPGRDINQNTCCFHCYSVWDNIWTPLIVERTDSSPLDKSDIAAMPHAVDRVTSAAAVDRVTAQCESLHRFPNLFVNASFRIYHTCCQTDVVNSKKFDALTWRVINTGVDPISRTTQSELTLRAFECSKFI